MSNIITADIPTFDDHVLAALYAIATPEELLRFLKTVRLIRAGQLVDPQSADLVVEIIKRLAERSGNNVT